MKHERHNLSDIDPVGRTAMCSVCGPTKLRSKGQGWRCVVVARRTKNVSDIRTGRSQRRHRPYREHIGEVCERCGFIPEDPVQLDCHHRDHDHSNNDPANIATLCANCHRLMHAKRARLSK